MVPEVTDVARFCRGCGADMIEYSEVAREDGWCVECAPECYRGGRYVG